MQASLENKLIPEGHLYTSRGLVDEHGLFGPTLDIFPIDEGAVEQVEDKDNDKDKGPQQEVNGVAEVVTAEELAIPISPTRQIEAQDRLSQSSCISITIHH